MKEKMLLFILAVVQFSHILDFMIIMPLGSQFMRIFDISPRQFSLIVSAYAGSAFVMGLFSAMFIDRFDRKQALFYTYIGFTIGTLACAIAPSYLVFLAARSVTGAFGGVLGALVLSIIGDTVPLKRRASAMGMVMTAFSVASVIGVPAGIYLAATPPARRSATTWTTTATARWTRARRTPAAGAACPGWRSATTSTTTATATPIAAAICAGSPPSA